MQVGELLFYKTLYHFLTLFIFTATQLHTYSNNMESNDGLQPA